MKMPRLLIVYHSRTGTARQMAKAAYDAASKETETHLKTAEDVTPDDLLRADGYLFAAPENLAALSGEMKAFFDRCYYPVLNRLNGRPYAQMIAAGSDGTNAVRQLARIATGWRLKAVQAPMIICTHAQTEAEIMAPKTVSQTDLKKCKDLGDGLAAGLAMGIF